MSELPEANLPLTALAQIEAAQLLNAVRSVEGVRSIPTLSLPVGRSAADLANEFPALEGSFQLNGYSGVKHCQN